MPSDLSGLREEFNEKMLRRRGTPHAEIWLNGERIVRELWEVTLDPEDCEIRTRKRLWCRLFGHKDPAAHTVTATATCHCGTLAMHVTSDDSPGGPGGRFIHVGRCIRCNAITDYPYARVAR